MMFTFDCDRIILIESEIKNEKLCQISFFFGNLQQHSNTTYFTYFRKYECKKSNAVPLFKLEP